jgi:hypothetical protein
MAGMATLTVWRFDSPYGARNALDLVERLRKEALLQLDDAAIVAWPDDRKKPKTEQLRSMAGMGALTGSCSGCCLGCCSSCRCSVWLSVPHSARLVAHWLMSASRPVYSRGPG